MYRFYTKSGKLVMIRLSSIVLIETFDTTGNLLQNDPIFGVVLELQEDIGSPRTFELESLREAEQLIENIEKAMLRD